MTFTLFTVLTKGSSLKLAKGLINAQKNVNNRQKCTKDIPTITKLKDFFKNYEKECVQFFEKIFKTVVGFLLRLKGPALHYKIKLFNRIYSMNSIKEAGYVYIVKQVL